MPVKFEERNSTEISIDSKTNSKTKKPKDTAFRQQRVPAWQPITSVGTTVPTFFLIAIAFVPVGIGMLWSSEKLMERIIPYTDCKNDDGKPCKDVIMNKKAIDRDCFCNINFKIDSDWKGDVFIFYALTNFFQNHRRYHNSINDDQLLGKTDVKDWGNLANNPSRDPCDPYRYCDDTTSCCNGAKGNGSCGNKLPNKTIYMPCGAIANSLFSDVISLK